MDKPLKDAVRIQLAVLNEIPDITNGEWGFAKDVALSDIFANKLCLMQGVTPVEFARTLAVGIQMYRRSRTVVYENMQEKLYT